MWQLSFLDLSLRPHPHLSSDSGFFFLLLVWFWALPTQLRGLPGAVDDVEGSFYLKKKKKQSDFFKGVKEHV